MRYPNLKLLIGKLKTLKQNFTDYVFVPVYIYLSNHPPYPIPLQPLARLYPPAPHGHPHQNPPLPPLPSPPHPPSLTAFLYAQQDLHTLPREERLKDSCTGGHDDHV